MKLDFLFGFLTPFAVLLVGILVLTIFAFWIGILGLIVFGLRNYTLITISLLWVGICVHYGVEEVRGEKLRRASKFNTEEHLDYKKGHNL